MVSLFVRAPDVHIEWIDDETPVAYSGLSGETHLLNPSAVALVEALDERRPVATPEVVQTLSDESGLPAEQVSELLAHAWTALASAGLIREACRASLPRK